MVLTMSEFGRTVKENGSAGTVHGHGNVMFVMGGGVQGGKVYGQPPRSEHAHYGRFHRARRAVAIHLAQCRGRGRPGC